jgi:hypothetical protein
VPNARPASISNVTLPRGTSPRCAGVWMKKRPARIGSSPCWLKVTQSASPTGSNFGFASEALGTSDLSRPRSAFEGRPSK